jgi:cell division protein FtsZ
MSTQIDSIMDSPIERKTVSIHVIGVGGAGCNTLTHLSAGQFEGVRFSALNTDSAALSRSPVESKLMLGSKSTRGLGAGGDPERGRAAALEDVDRIRVLVAEAGVVFVVAGLGGGTGTGAAPVVARLAKEAGALVLGIVILPFDCEGARRQRQAQLGFQDLKQSADAVISLPNQKVFRLIDENTSLLDAFAITNKFVAQGVGAVYRLMTRPGLINVDFADLCSVMQGKHAETSLATAEARGENRAREAVQKILEHPLVENCHALAEASAVLVSIAGGPDLTMAEINRIMEQINRHCEQAHIIMGAAIDEELADAISVTLLASASNAGSQDNLLPATEGPAIESDQRAVGIAISSRPGRRDVVIPAAPQDLSGPVAVGTTGNSARPKKQASRLRQGQLQLEVLSKGRFEKSEPTIHQGQDLDVPTYIRRGIPLN